MRKITEIIISLFFITGLSAQCVSVELSLSWEKNEGYIKEDTFCCTPFLNITYRNNTNDSLYFLKLSNSRQGFPEVPFSCIIKCDYSQMPTGSYFAKDSFYIALDSWEIVLVEEVHDEHEIHPINDHIQHINEYVYRKYIKSEFKDDDFLFFKESDFANQQISERAKNQFLFLAPGEIYVDTYNLFAFQLAGGKYTTFRYKENYFDNEVVLLETDPEKDGLLTPPIKLPEEVDGYKLYSGSFKTNQVTMTF